MRVLVAVLVTILVVGVGSVEAARLITGGQVKNSSLTGADVKNGSLTVKDFSTGARNALRGPRGFQGAPGVQGTPGAPGRNGVTDIAYVDSEIVTVAPGDADAALASCPADRIATGGSEGAASTAALEIENLFVAADGVVIVGVNNGPDPAPLQARAACAKY